MTPTDNFIRDLRLRQAASFGGVLVVTSDEHTAIKHVHKAVAQSADLYRWTCASGLVSIDKEDPNKARKIEQNDIIDTLRGLQKTTLAHKEAQAIILIGAMPLIEHEAFIRRLLVETIEAARRGGHLIVLLETSDAVPPDLRDVVTVLRHPLPDRASTEPEIASTLADAGLDAPSEDAIEACKGLTLSRQLDAVGLAAVEASENGVRQIDASTVRRFKEREIARLPFLTVSEPTKAFADLLGHEGLKNFLRRRQRGFSDEARASGLPVPRGVVFCGPPGTGKSRFGEATAAEWRVPYLVANMASIYSSMLGETEQNVEKLIEISERMAPCVLLIDEVERAVGTGGERDGGTAERVLGRLLTWSATKTAPVFVVYTSNYPDRLPPALIRKGRVDQIFFLDLPNEGERAHVLSYYLQQGGIQHRVTAAEVVKIAMDSEGWTPAEIEAAVGEARYLAFADDERPVEARDLIEEMSRVVPVSRSMAQEVARMRAWATQYATPTTMPVHVKVETETGPRRKIRA